MRKKVYVISTKSATREKKKNKKKFSNAVKLRLEALNRTDSDFRVSMNIFF